VKFSRTVWLLGWVSFFTDLASEMIYPLLPLFLTRVLGAGAMSLGVIEGVAEAANSALKILSGWLSDRWNARKPIVLAGYALSSAVRPLMAAVGIWWHVLVLRFFDRFGKGVRGAPRDAMLASEAAEDRRGRVFGFQRGMDHAGAVAGPLLASLFLFFYPGEYRTLFALTVIPGLIVVALLMALPSDSRAPVGPAFRPAEPSANWRALPSSLYRVLAVILLFSIGNSSDAFLLLRLTDLGVGAALIPLLWAALHVVKSSSSMIGGALADRWGRRRLIVAGWVYYSAIYGGFAYFESATALIAIFIAYGLYFGLTEGAERALVADLAPAGSHGTAFGLYNGVLGVGALIASVLFGWIWSAVGAEAAFATGAALALVAAALLWRTPSPLDGLGVP
jgi:MFS family permease